MIQVNPGMAILLQPGAQYPLVVIAIASGAVLAWQSRPKASLEIKQLTCLRCGNRWHPRIIDGKVKIPETCPDKDCRSPYWRTKSKREKKK